MWELGFLLLSIILAVVLTFSEKNPIRVFIVTWDDLTKALIYFSRKKVYYYAKFRFNCVTHFVFRLNEISLIIPKLRRSG